MDCEQGCCLDSAFCRQSIMTRGYALLLVPNVHAIFNHIYLFVVVIRLIFVYTNTYSTLSKWTLFKRDIRVFLRILRKFSVKRKYLYKYSIVVASKPSVIYFVCTKRWMVMSTKYRQSITLGPRQRKYIFSLNIHNNFAFLIRVLVLFVYPTNFIMSPEQRQTKKWRKG